MKTTGGPRPWRQRSSLFSKPNPVQRVEHIVWSDRRPRTQREGNVFAGIFGRVARAVRRMLFGAPPAEVIVPAPPTDEPPGGGDDMAGSGVPRRPPDQSGSGSVALVEPTVGESGFEEQDDPHTRPIR
jgi:hypothetical protein